MFRRFLLLFLALVVAGCASVPLRTMWEMRGMGPDTFTQVDPSEVQAAVMSEALFMEQPGLDTASLELFMKLADGSEHQFTYELVDVTNREVHRLPAPRREMAWRVYELDREQIEDFRSMQADFQRWLSRDDPEAEEFRLAVRFLDSERSARVMEDIEQSAAANGDADSGSGDVEALLDEWNRDGIRVRVDLQLFEERGFMQLIRTRRIPINRGSQDPDGADIIDS